MSISSLLCAVAAAGALAIALSPTIDARADASFAWHMTQHLVLLFIVPLFVLAARPFRAFTQIAPKDAVAATVRATRALHAVANPVFTLCCFIGIMWVSHFSGLYESALEHPAVHIVEHALYVSAGILFWLPVLSPPPLRPLPYPARLLYLLVALPQGALLAFALSGARSVLYDHYASVEGVAQALADQSNAAAVMWIGGGLMLFVTFLATFGAWAMRENREAVSGGAS